MGYNNMNSKNTKYEPTIGLEIHAQLKTSSKMFSADASDFGGKINSRISPVSLALPGTLPVLNESAIDLAISTGLALKCQVNLVSNFSRKHYFYPDLPKGYQITQGEPPLLEKGYVSVGKKKISIARIHIEEDAGQSYHRDEKTLVDFNRAGIPLIEIVSAPEISSAKEAADYARKVRQILRYLEICDGNLQEGSMRCDCNVSLRPKDSPKLGVRVEIKNVNSFKFIEKAIDFEICRQADLLDRGEAFFQQTRAFNPKTGETFLLRDKEEAKDYRYFSEPDLLPLEVSEERVKSLGHKMCELPDAKIERFCKDYGLSFYDAENLTREKESADYFEQIVKMEVPAKSVANWMLGDISRYLNESKKEINELPFSKEDLATLLKMNFQGALSSTNAKVVFEKLCNGESDVKKISEDNNLSSISDVETIKKWVDSVILENSAQKKEYQSGKTKLFGFFVGKVMKASGGRVDPKVLNEVLKEGLMKP